MARRIPVVIALLISVMLFSLIPASADPIRITGGSVIAENRGIGTVDIHGTQGFQLHFTQGLFDTTGPWMCCPVAPGGSIDFMTFLGGSDASARRLEFNGMEFTSIGEASVVLHIVGGAIITPPLSKSAVLSAPFDLRSTELHLFDFGGEPFVAVPLIGRGTVTIQLTPNPFVPLWEFGRVRYDFVDANAVPEPATLLLLGTGVLALASKRHQRRRRSGTIRC